MAKKVKKVEAKPDFAFGYVADDGQILMRSVCRHEEGSDELYNAIFGRHPLGRNTRMPLLVVADTPANRKRLGVKRG